MHLAGLSGRIGHVAAEGEHLVFGSENQWIFVDYADPHQPVVRAHLQLPSKIKAVFLSGGWAHAVGDSVRSSRIPRIWTARWPMGDQPRVLGSYTLERSSRILAREGSYLVSHDHRTGVEARSNLRPIFEAWLPLAVVERR